MANVFTNKTIHVDTTFTGGYQAARKTATGTVNVNPLRIVGAKLLGGTTASTAVISDINGKVLATLQCPIGGTDSLGLSTPVRWDDFNVTLTGTGAFLEIYQG